MDPEKPKFNWQRMLITSGIVLFAALAVGGTTWYVMDKSANEIKTANDSSVASLQKQIDELKLASKTTTTATTTEVDPTANWKTYTDDTVGFTLKYPTGIALEPQMTKTTGNYLVVNVQKMTDITDPTLGYDKVTAATDFNAVSAGDPSTPIGMANSSSYKLLNVKGAVGKESIINAVLDVCNVQLRREAYIYKNGYRIRLTYVYDLSSLMSDNPTYFKSSAECSGQTWAVSAGSNFVTDLMAGKTDANTQSWYKQFDNMIKSITFN